jgi:predicted ATPase
MNRWESVLEGEGQVALIIGEAGIGKSRLLQRFNEQIAGTPHTWIEAGAGAFFQNTPFYPVSEMLRQFLGEAQPQDQVAQLETRLSLADLKPAEAIPLIAPLLNLPLPTDYPPSTLPPEQQRRRLLATLVAWVLGAARTQPLVIVIEDLHWADPSTLELTQLLVEQRTPARLLLLYTARPEFHAPWPMRASHADQPGYFYPTPQKGKIHPSEENWTRLDRYRSRLFALTELPHFAPNLLHRSAVGALRACGKRG